MYQTWTIGGSGGFSQHASLYYNNKKTNSEIEDGSTGSYTPPVDLNPDSDRVDEDEEW